MFRTPHKQQTHSQNALKSNTRTNALSNAAPSGSNISMMHSGSKSLKGTLFAETSVGHLSLNSSHMKSGGLVASTIKRRTPGTPILSSIQLPNQQEYEYFVQSSRYTIARISTIPKLSNVPAQAAMPVILDPCSGYIAECGSSFLNIWNAKNSIIPLIKLLLPLYERSAIERACVACFISNSNQASSATGVIAVNAAGLIRAWGNVDISKQFEEFDLQFDESCLPLSLTRVSVSLSTYSKKLMKL